MPFQVVATSQGVVLAVGRSPKLVGAQGANVVDADLALGSFVDLACCAGRCTELCFGRLGACWVLLAIL